MRKGTDKDWEQRAGCMTFPDAVAKEPVPWWERSNFFMGKVLNLAASWTIIMKRCEKRDGGKPENISSS